MDLLLVSFSMPARLPSLKEHILVLFLPFKPINFRQTRYVRMYGSGPDTNLHSAYWINGGSLAF